MKSAKRIFLASATALSLLFSPLACDNKKNEANIIKSYNTVQQVKNLQQLENIIANNKKVVACISATWCLPCQNYAPIFEETAKDYKKDVVFCKFVTDKGWEGGEFKKILNEYNFDAVPKTILFKNGKEVHRLYNADKEGLRGLIDHYLFDKDKPKEMFEGLTEELVRFCDCVAESSFHIAVAVATDIDDDGKEDLQGYKQLFEKLEMKFEEGKPLEHYKGIIRNSIINTPWEETQEYEFNGKEIKPVSYKTKCNKLIDACWSMFSEKDKLTYQKLLGKFENLLEVKELKNKSLYNKSVEE